MSDDECDIPAKLIPANVTPLERDARYYREQAVACDRLLEGLTEARRRSSETAAFWHRVRRERDLWAQLADELDAYLEHEPAGALF